MLCFVLFVCVIFGYYGNATKQDRNKLQWTARAAEKRLVKIGANLPFTQVLNSLRMENWVGNVSADPSLPQHNVFQLLASGRRFRSLSAKNNFFPQVKKH